MKNCPLIISNNKTKNQNKKWFRQKYVDTYKTW